MAENDISSQEKINLLVRDNKNLKSEINGLRSQIDRLQSRTKDLQDSNKSLHEQVQKLSKTKDDLEELQRQKDDLFSLIIHDIKNPAAIIQGLVDLLKSYNYNAVDQQDIIKDIAETTTRIVNLSKEVSRVMALEGTSLNLEMEEADINEIINDVFRVNQISANKKMIDLMKKLGEDIPQAVMDAQKVSEILDNMLSNAIKFTPKGGKVLVSSSFKDDYVVVDVKDNGLGLSEDDLRKAFKKGTRLSSQPTGGESSTGLGLWIIKKLVEAHKGRVWVKSALGKGSTFSFSIPLKQTG